MELALQGLVFLLAGKEVHDVKLQQQESGNKCQGAVFEA